MNDAISESLQALGRGFHEVMGLFARLRAIKGLKDFVNCGEVICIKRHVVQKSQRLMNLIEVG